MRIIREWAGWRLTQEGYGYFLTRPDDPAWFRPIQAKTDETAIVEADRVATDDGDAPPIRWELQPHSKEKCFEIALHVEQELKRKGQEPGSLRELVATVCKIEWMV